MAINEGLYGKSKRDVPHRTSKGNKAGRASKHVLRNISLEPSAKRYMSERIIIPTVLYITETYET